MDNKIDLSQFLDSSYKNIHMNVGVVDFLRELFTNNKFLLYSEKDIPIILEHIIGACDKISRN